MSWRQVEAELEKARAQVDHGNAAGAVEVIKQILGIDPENAEAYALLAVCRLAQERIDDASRAIATALSLESQAPGLHYIAGQVALARLDWPNAEAAFRQAIDLAPEDAEGYLGMAVICQSRRNDREALDWLARAHEAEPENPGAMVLEGRLRLDRGEIGEAEALGIRALRIDPQHIGACLLTGEVLCRRGDIEGATEHAVLAISQDPEDDGALELLAQIRSRRNPLFGLWWRSELAMKRFGPMARGVVIVALLAAYAITSDILRAQGHEDWNYVLTGVVFPLGLYFAFGQMLLTWRIEREKRKIRLDSSF